jgi:hypothetical protein
VALIATANLLLKFLVEVAAVAACAYATFRLVPHPVWRLVAAILVPIVVIVVWAVFMAPNADTRLGMPWRIIAELAVFVGAAVLLWLADVRVPAVIFGAVAVVCDLLSVLLERYEP